MANWRCRSQTYSMEAYLSTFSISTWHLLAVFRWLALGHHFNLLHCSLWAHGNVQEQADLKEICDSISQTLILKLAIYPIPIIVSQPKECHFVKDFFTLFLPSSRDLYTECWAERLPLMWSAASQVSQDGHDGDYSITIQSPPFATCKWCWWIYKN